MGNFKFDFGYNPPAGDRGYEQINPKTYMSDLHNVLDVASENFTSLWASDHLNYGSEFRIECWTLLTWMAAKYPETMLGTVVMCNSFRHPPLLAKMTATLQHMSNGKMILGYGAGWYENEYTSYGFDYPRAGVRLDMFEEAVKIIKLMWNDSPANYSGEFYEINNVFCEPRPNPDPVLMLGGGGEKKTLKIVAQHADWWNDVMRKPEALKRKLDVLKSHCLTVGRDYNNIRKTVSARFIIDKDHRKALKLADKIKRVNQYTGQYDQMIVGDPSAVIDQLNELGDLGFDLVVTSFPSFQDLSYIKLFAEEVIPDFL
ncbi:MAG: hypothetical protein CL882_04845 [Dehalococcoidia bacterium]|nr:hypothetical protein [Dehalococcoidia bacterium]